MKNKISEFCGETLLKNLLEQLDGMISIYSKEEGIESCKELSEAWSLCNKILTFDYYEKSEPIIEDFYKKVNSNDFKEAMSLNSKWTKQYNKDRKNKQKDLSKLFSIITENIEDWC